jgi:hypothetical protein
MGREVLGDVAKGPQAASRSVYEAEFKVPSLGDLEGVSALVGGMLERALEDVQG